LNRKAIVLQGIKEKAGGGSNPAYQRGGGKTERGRPRRARNKSAKAPRKLVTS